MSFQTPITIKKALNEISRNKYLLPSIQREFVWDTNQIEVLFDSIMQNFPINSFLFWKVFGERVTDYKFYKFITDYHERDNYRNDVYNTSGENEIIAILDGQQRLTSLYIGLKGSYTYKEPRKRWDNDSAFQKRNLYLNILSESKDIDKKYDFKFLTEDESKDNDKDTLWFKVGDILNIESTYDLNSFVFDKQAKLGISSNKSRYALDTLMRLHDTVNNKASINYFLEEDQSLDKVLNIFIRVNSGGTSLSYSDLLLSIASAQWKKKDAREEITKFVDEINSIGDGFNFNKDFVLKSCLVLSGIQNISFKVDNFNQKNMLKIESLWDNIKESIRLSVLLAESFGYNRDTLTSNYALIPIAIYINKLGNQKNFIDSPKFEIDRKNIFKFLIISLLKRLFGGQPDNVLKPIRDIINENQLSFPINEIKDKFKGTNKSLSFDNEDIDSLFDYKYNQAYTYSILALLYPSLSFKNKFHKDHIYPKSIFTSKNLDSLGLNKDDMEFYLGNFDFLSNLQLLEGLHNIDKSNKDFKEWLDSNFTDNEDKKSYMKKNYIPSNIDLSLNNFPEFIEERQKLIRNYLIKILD
ncbi:DUF262 domain-containing protein [Paenalcaligenes faecalis]|uniref:DUF262 domain-containing protein n=1 Tax=Paenalcaligenes faecalis TaxID=2980099 RepID=UPI0022B9B950|nr:DUF262 domain-containing protein [Paenalcaligenes faecalis]